MTVLSRQESLGVDPLGRLLLRFSLPGIVGMLITALYNIIDRAFVGNYAGSFALGGVTIVFPINLIMMSFGMLIGVGASALVSIAIGAGHMQRAEKLLGQAFMLLIWVSLGTTLICVPLLPSILHLFGATPEIYPHAYTYALIILLGNVLAGMGFGMNNLVRAEGSPMIAMGSMLIAGALHIVLDWVLIFYFAMGVAGAALSTIISQGAVALWVVWFFTKGKRASLRLRRANFKLELDKVRSILRVGLAPCILQITMVVLLAIVNRSILHYFAAEASLTIAAFGVANSVLELFILPLLGISQGCQPILGYNYGARNFSRVRSTVRLALIVGTTWAVLCYIPVMLVPDKLVYVFNPHDAMLIERAAHILRISNLFLPGMAIGIIGSQYFQALNKPKQSIFLSASRQFLFLVPALLILPHFAGPFGIFYAYCLSDVMSILITALFFSFERRDLAEEEKQYLAQKANPVGLDTV